ncbi:MAG: hypothetical protein IT561_09120 [Alphaproteobacteria bacterium]|nr:hypothetical protein [Alphaproteobacteria bacterium]
MGFTSPIVPDFVAGLGFELAFNAGWDNSYELYGDMFWAAKTAAPSADPSPIEALSDYRRPIVPVDEVDSAKPLAIEYK